MSSTFSENPRQQIEAQLTALLLGELSGEEATAVRGAIERDPSLAALHSQLAQTIGLLREVAASPAAATTTPGVPIQLSAERRERLKAAFKVSVLSAQSRDLTWVVPMSIAAVLMALIGAV